jgi:hypothetical protein
VRRNGCKRTLVKQVNDNNSAIQKSSDMLLR